MIGSTAPDIAPPYEYLNVNIDYVDTRFSAAVCRIAPDNGA